MSIVYKRRGNRVYLYEQKSYRENRKVKTWSRYLGPLLGGLIEANRTPRPPKPLRDDAQEREDRALAVAARAAAKIDAMQSEIYGETATERASRLAEESRFDQNKFLAETAGPKEMNGEPDSAEADNS